MSIETKERLSTQAPVEQKNPKKSKGKKNRLPAKRTMNLFYKPDRTTKPATTALYVLFVLVCLLGLGKFLVYDIWMETNLAKQTLAAAEAELNGVMMELTDYSEVKERYQRYAATDEERELLDRMEILDLLDSAVGETADIDSISISANAVQIKFSGVTLAQTAEIVRKLEASPLVAHITVNTASTTKEGYDYDYDYDFDYSSLVQTNAMIQLQKEADE